MAFDDFLDELDQASGGPGKPGFALVTVFPCFKSLVSGHSPEITTQKYDPDIPGDMEAQRKIIADRLIALGVNLEDPHDRINKGIGMIVHADTAYPKSWEKDMPQILVSFMDNYKGVGDPNTPEFKPGLKQYLRNLRAAGKFPNEKWAGDYWMKFVWVPDLGGKKQPKTDTKPERVRYVYMPVDVYPTREAMVVAAVAEGVLPEDGATEPPPPKDWPPELWAQFKPKVLAGCQAGNWLPETLKNVSKEFGVPVEYLASLKPG